MTSNEDYAKTPGLVFTGVEVSAASGTAVPTLELRIKVKCTGGVVRSILLTTIVDIAVARRDYSAAEQGKLVEVFGEPNQWGTTLRGLEWARPTTVVPGFERETTVSLRLPCSYDFDLATTKYMAAVSGEIALDLKFNGTIFHSGPHGSLQASQLPWDHELTATFPAQLWHGLLDRYYGPQRWVRLSESSIEELAAYKARRAHLSWDAAVCELLAAAKEETAPHG